MNEIVFQCPDCRGRLIKAEKCYICENCKLKWEIRNNIPIFSKYDFYWNRIPRERMRLINMYAAKGNWRSALNELLFPNERYLFDYATNKIRTNWINLLPLSSETKALDIGCNLGLISVELSKSCKFVIAADPTLETLEFVDIRRRQEKISNLYPVCIPPLDFASLPFPDSYFDVVILNGVLEWVGGLNKKLKPMEVQKEGLKEIKRVLKPGGCLYIGIENRFSYSYFLGSFDHSGLPFTSILPRALSNILTQLFKNKDYRTYTYSYYGYKSLLENVGFSDIKFYLPIPSYRYPELILPLDNKDNIKLLRDHYRGRGDIKDKIRTYLLLIIHGLHLEKALSNSFSIIARNELAK